MRVADALELALLQHPQQLHLHARAHGADLVEKQRALVRLLESALPRADRAGERAAHVTEQLGLQQRFRNRAAVERDEPLRAARAVVMDRARDDFLAGAGLAGHEDGARRRRHGLQQLKQVAHRRAAADEPFELVSLLSCERRYAFSALSRRCSSAEFSAWSSSSNWKGFVTKSVAPRLIASTASFTVPYR